MTGVDVWGRSSYDGVTEDELNLRVLKTGDSMTGNLVMNGNHIIGLPLNICQIVDWSEAPSYKVVQNKVSEMLVGKVDKSGDVMTGNLALNIGEDRVRSLGCSNLIFGKGFMLLLGTPQNCIKFDLQEPVPEPIKLCSSNGVLVRLDNSDIIRFGTNGREKEILAYQRIKLFTELDANVNTIINLAEPGASSDAATKAYVDNKLCYEGVIPSLEANNSKTGYTVLASSEYNASHLACNAFKLMPDTWWATFNVTSNFWIKVSIPSPIRIWKFVLCGKASAERIYNWRLEGSMDNVNWTSLYLATNSYVGLIPISFRVATSEHFQYYRIFVVNAEYGNPGLRYFQLYRYLV